MQRELPVVALSVLCRDALSWSEVLQKVPFGFAAWEQTELPAQAARLGRVAQPALLAVAPSVQCRDAQSCSEVLQKVPFGRAVSEPLAFLAQFLAQAVHRELAVRQAARQEPFARVPSAASPAGSAPSEAARPLAGSDASPGVERAEVVLPAGSDAAVELLLATAPLAAPGDEAVLQREARGAAEVRHGAALQALPSEVDLSALPSAAASHAPSHDLVPPAPAQPEQQASAHAMPRV